MPQFRQRRRTGLFYALLALIAVVTTTCVDSPFQPGQAVTASFDVEALLSAAQSSPIPIEAFVVELRRVSDSSVVVNDTIYADSIGLAADADSVVLDVMVPLESDPEQFYASVSVIGGGIEWYVVFGVVTASTRAPLEGEVLVAVYVGPGWDGTDVTLSLSDTTITGGDSVLVTGTVYRDQTAIADAPVGFASSDEALVPEPRQVGLNQAWVFAPAALTDSVTISATAPTAQDPLTASGTLRFFARPDQLVIVSGNNLNMNPGEQAADPLVVELLDAAGDPYTRGYEVVFSVAAGPAGTSVAPDTVQTDGQGLAQTTLTAGDAAGVVQVTAEGPNLSGSPVTFTASVADVSGPANIIIVAGNNQSATVATAVTTAPSVMVTDAVGGPVSAEQVVFTMTAGGGTLTGATTTTDPSGIATVGSWTLGQTAGANTITATVGGLQPVTFTATGTADVPDTIFVVTGNDQTADAGAPLPAPLVVEVQDQYGNPTPNMSVVWTALDGSMAVGNVDTDATGRAQNTWTLGTNSQSQTATATFGALQPAVFSATAIFQTPSILLDLIGADRIPVGSSADLQITLTSPAPVDGTTVAVTSDNAAIIDVQSPGTVFIPEGQSTGQIALDGVTSGATTVRATAAGYNDGATTVEASALVLSLPTTLNVPFGGTASLPVQISTPAPSGGEVITLVSSDPAIVALVTPTVTIPEGLQTANASVYGIFPGAVTVTGTSGTYGTAQSAVSTTANLNITQSSIAINESFGGEITVRLESAGQPIAAPSPGITVALTPADPGCVAVTSPVVIPAGLVDIAAPVSFGGATTTPCNTTISATASDITPDNISVTVNVAPGITVTSRTIGAGLHRNTSANLGASNHNGVDVVLTSSDPQVLLLSPNSSTAGSASINVHVDNGYTSVSYYVQGVEGTTGTATVTVAAPGFTDGTGTMTVAQPGLQLSGLVANTTTLSPDDPFQIRIGITDVNQTYLAEYQSVRPGAPGPLTVTITSSNAAVGQLVTTPDTGATATVNIDPGYYYSYSSVGAGGVAFDPLTGGTTTVSSTIPGYFALINATQDVNISAPGISVTARTVGGGLQRSTSATLGASNHGGIDVVLTSSDSQVLLLSPDATTAGSGSITVSVNDLNTSVSYYVQGVEGATGTATVTVSADGFTDGTGTMTVAEPAVQLYGLVPSTTTLSPDDPFQVRIGISDANQTYMAENQSVRAGAPGPLTATVTSSMAFGELVTTPDTGRSVTVQIAEGLYYSATSVAAGGVAFHPLTEGTTTVSTSIPGYFALLAASQDLPVSAPGITVTSRTVGGGLQRSTSATLGASSHNGVDVLLTSSDPQVLLLSPNSTTAGAPSITVPVSDGYTSVSYHVQGVEGATGTATVTVSADGFTNGTGTITVAQPAVQLYGLVASTTTLSAEDPFQVRVGISDVNQTYMTEYQNVRAGGADSLTATVTSGTPGVGELVTTVLTAGTVTVGIPQQTYYSAGSVATGGVAFRPLTAGTSTVSTSIPGYFSLLNATQDVTVSAPGITVTARTVGAGLQRSTSAYLGASNHNGVDVVLTSSNSSVVLLSPDDTTAGTASITVRLDAGQTTASYYVQGVEGATGTAVVTVTADGFTDGTAAMTVAQPAVQLYGVRTPIDAGAADDVFQVRVGVPDVNQTYMTDYQGVRAGGPGSLTATITSSDAGVGNLVTTSLPDGAGTVTVQIAEGFYYSPTTVTAGGVAFRPLAAGTTTVATTIPSYVVLPAAAVVVTVTTP